MLLLTKKIYSDAIREGSKQFEIRAGRRYRNVGVGDYLSINGYFRVTVDRVDAHSRQSLIEAMPDWRAAIEDCYPGTENEFYVFHFKPPQPEDFRRRVAA